MISKDDLVAAEIRYCMIDKFNLPMQLLYFVGLCRQEKSRVGDR